MSFPFANQQCLINQLIEMRVTLNPHGKRTLPPLQKELFQQHMVAPQVHLESTVKLTEQITRLISSLRLAPQQSTQQEFELEHRDRGVILSLPEVLSDTMMKQWVGSMCQKVVSSAFMHYKTDHLTFDQAKVFCSEWILRNVVSLTDKFQLSPKHIADINTFLKKRVLPFLKKKYPMTETKMVSKGLVSAAKEIQHYQNLVNDFFAQTNVVFSHRQSGKYHDLIMKFVNQVVSQVDMPSKYSELSNFKDFDNFMTNLFQKVENLTWMKQEHNAENQAGEELQKNSSAALNEYKQKVKSYTHFAIGRKVEEDFIGFSEAEIESEKITVKSPSILRILVKWCEQLWQKFDAPDYFLNRFQSCRTEGQKQTRFLAKWIRSGINWHILAEKQKIKDFMRQIVKNNYEIQSSVLLQQLLNTQDDHFQVSRIEKACGKFSVKMINVLHQYVILYLNRLIHGLLQVAKNLFGKKNMFAPAQWSSPPCLLSFKIGDIMRCKCSSKEQEILKIFKELEKVSRDSPHILRIIRLKNRLNRDTSDILINVKFNSSVLCEIQLAVNTTQSNKFIECSNKLNHFLYEIQRSPFGPITELCSVWQFFDSRAKIYQGLIHEEANVERNVVQPHLCELRKEEKQSSLKPYHMPFICSDCRLLYTHSNFIVTHKKCQGCLYWKCAICQMYQESRSAQNEQRLINKIFLDEEARANCLGYQYCQDMILSGACVFVHSQKIKVQFFQFIRAKGKSCVFGIENNKIYLIRNLTNPLHMEEFLTNNLIFTFKPEYLQKQMRGVSKHSAIVEYFYPEQIKRVIKKQSSLVSLKQAGLSQIECESVLSGLRGYSTSVRSLELSRNKLSEISLIIDGFPNLKLLELNYNPIQSYDNLQKLWQIEQLHMYDCKLTSIPKSVLQLSNLTEFRISKNTISNIPKQINLLQKLALFNISENKLVSIPRELLCLPNLTVLNLSANKIMELPQDMHQLTKLVHIQLRANQIKSISPLTTIPSLRICDARENRISQIPDEIKSLVCLESLDVSTNLIVSVSVHLGQLHRLVDLNLEHNNLKKELPDELFGDISLQRLKMSQLQLACLPQSLGKLRKLQIIYAQGNSLSIIPPFFAGLHALQEIYLQKNSMTDIPDLVFQLKNLKKLMLNKNKISVLSSKVSHAKHLEVLKLSNNCITVLPHGLRDCISLRYLQLNGNQISLIPKDLEQMIHLEVFKIDRNPITKIECYDFVKKFESVKALAQTLQKTQHFFLVDQYCNGDGSILFNEVVCGQLTSLDFSGQKLNRLPKRLSKLRSLTQLNVSKNSLTEIDQCVLEIASLKKLDYSSNLLTQLPVEIRRMIQLEELNVSHNNVPHNDAPHNDAPPKSFSQSITSLCQLNLRCLSIDSCGIRELPDKIASLNQIVSLSCSGNALQALPSSFIALNTLRKLDVSSNDFRDMPKQISCIALDQLNMSGNRLRSIPVFLWNMRTLRVLQLDAVGVPQIPAEIANLTSLERFSFQKNELKRLPKAITQLKKLQLLSLFQNQLGEETEKLKDLSVSLTQLNLGENAIVNIDFLCCFTKLRLLQLEGNFIQFVPRRLENLSSIQEGKLFLDSNPLSIVNCRDFLLRKASGSTKMKIESVMKDTQ